MHIHKHLTPAAIYMYVHTVICYVSELTKTVLPLCASVSFGRN